MMINTYIHICIYIFQVSRALVHKAEMVEMAIKNCGDYKWCSPISGFLPLDKFAFPSFSYS